MPLGKGPCEAPRKRLLHEPLAPSLVKAPWTGPGLVEGSLKGAIPPWASRKGRTRLPLERRVLAFHGPPLPPGPQTGLHWAFRPRPFSCAAPRTGPKAPRAVLARPKAPVVSAASSTAPKFGPRAVPTKASSLKGPPHGPSKWALEMGPRNGPVRNGPVRNGPVQEASGQRVPLWTTLALARLLVRAQRHEWSPNRNSPYSLSSIWAVMGCHADGIHSCGASSPEAPLFRVSRPWTRLEARGSWPLP